ncbi:glycoside hydrolase family 2 protein, partial [[Kitasatospora] papulosa]
ATAVRGVTRVPLPPAIAEPDDSTREVLVAELGDLRVVEFYEEDTRLALPPARYDVTVTQGDESGIGYRVTVTARTLLRDLALFPDRLDPAAEVDDMLVTLLPGERAVFHVTGAVLEDPEALGSRPVLRCVNDLVDG